MLSALPHTPPIDYVNVQVGIFDVSGGIFVKILHGDKFMGGSKTKTSSALGDIIAFDRILKDENVTQLRARLASETFRGAAVQASFRAAGLCGGVNQSFGPSGSDPSTAVDLALERQACL